jgi:thioredoxin 1
MPDRRRHLLVRAAPWTVGLGLGAALAVLLPGCLGASKPLTPVTESNFEEVVLRSKQPVLVDFSAKWCGPCRQMEPVLENLAAELEGQVAVVQVDVDTARGLAGRYGVDPIPCFILFKNGKAVAHIVGMTSKRQLITMIKGDR